MLLFSQREWVETLTKTKKQKKPTKPKNYLHLKDKDTKIVIIGEEKEKNLIYFLTLFISFFLRNKNEENLQKTKKINDFVCPDLWCKESEQEMEEKNFFAEKFSSLKKNLFGKEIEVKNNYYDNENENQSVNNRFSCEEEVSPITKQKNKEKKKIFSEKFYEEEKNFECDEKTDLNNERLTPNNLEKYKEEDLKKYEENVKKKFFQRKVSDPQNIDNFGLSSSSNSSPLYSPTNSISATSPTSFISIYGQSHTSIKSVLSIVPFVPNL